MTLDFGVCLGLKRKQEKNSEEPHGFHTQAEVPRSWRTRKNQVLTIPPPIWLKGEWITFSQLQSDQSKKNPKFGLRPSLRNIIHIKLKHLNISKYI